MRRNVVILACLGAALLLAGVLCQMSFSGGEPQGGPKRAAEAPAGRPPEIPLPIRQVVLFNTGVGYFQREGQVEGAADVELSFPASDMNDLLKSLILQDAGGGKVSAVNYDSFDPLEKTLRSFAIDLSTYPTFGQILNQARGEKVEVVCLEGPEKKDAAGREPAKVGVRPVKTAGTIVGMEAQAKPGELREQEVLNLATDEGLRSVALERVASVRFLNPALEKEFHRALRVLARAHDTQKKSVILGFRGEGKRTVRVGYVVERPIWKTSYRLRIDGDHKLFLQAWAMVENTSDDDWNDVHMVLVSGRPISFKMNLYEPLYLPRPEVEPELFASLRPPLYGGSIPTPTAEGGPPDIIKVPPGSAAPPGFGQFGQFGLGGGAGLTGGFQGGLFQGQFGGQAAQLGQFGGQGNFPPNRYQNANGLAGNFNAKLTYEQLQERRRQQRQAQEEARKVGSTVAGLNFKEGIASVADAGEVGDYYQYVLDQKISLPRQKSALLPIINHGVEGTKVSIYNAGVQPKFPLLGLRLRNTSGQPLTQGPITVYEGQTYAGDTRVMDLQPGEERLLSYALDQGTEVVTADAAAPGPELYFKVGSDHVAASYTVRHTRTYTLRNRSKNDRRMIIEHPMTAGWKLIEPGKPAEKSRDLYRFEVKVPSGKTVEFAVTEEEERDTTVKLAASGAVRTGEPREDIHVKTLTQLFAPKLTGLRFEKGVLVMTRQERSSTTYFVQNLSPSERQCNVDYVVHAGWRLLADADVVKVGPAVHRVTIKVPAGKTAAHEFHEERTVTDNAPPLASLGEERIKELAGSPAAGDGARAGLVRALGLLRKLADARARLGDLEKQRKALTEDQARMRDNLHIIPPTSDHYKKFLEKFVAQETQIEGLQKQLREAQVALQQLQNEYDVFIAGLTAE